MIVKPVTKAGRCRFPGCMTRQRHETELCKIHRPQLPSRRGFCSNCGAHLMLICPSCCAEQPRTLAIAARAAAKRYERKAADVAAKKATG